MFSHSLSALGEERREALLDEARRARLARAANSGVRKRRHRLAGVLVALGRAIIAIGARLEAEEEIAI
ncbi:MAG TPA: hypothetical protein VGG22_09895 [Candidatus Baltobacteraceae bacterium]